MADPIIETRTGEEGDYLLGPITAAQLPQLDKLFSESDIAAIRARLENKEGETGIPAAMLVSSADRQTRSVVLGEIKDGVFAADRFRTVTSRGVSASEQFIDPATDSPSAALPLRENGRIVPSEARRFIDTLPDDAKMANYPIRLPIDNPIEALGYTNAAEIGEFSLPGKSTGMTLEQIIPRTLEQSNGVFLGEHHNRPAILQAVTRMLPQLENAGVKTISYELHQSTMDVLAGADTIEDAIRERPMVVGQNYTALHALARAAKEKGIKVLGHERTTPEIEEIIAKKTWSEEDRQAYNTDFAQSVTQEGMVGRNRWAADYIDTHKADGKVLAIGGSAHSKGAPGKERPQYAPLNALLLYPSIDIYPIEGNLPDKAVGAIHETDEPKDGIQKPADFHVILPPDLARQLQQAGMTPTPEEAAPNVIPRKSQEKSGRGIRFPF